MISKTLMGLMAALAFGIAQAHDNATLDASVSPHGGQTRMAGAYHFELVLDKAAKAGKPAPVRIFLSDHGGQGVSAQGVEGVATFLGAGGKSKLTLLPDGPHSLAGSGVYGVEPGLKVVVSLTFPGGQTEQARFEPFKSLVPAAVKPE